MGRSKRIRKQRRDFDRTVDELEARDERNEARRSDRQFRAAQGLLSRLETFNNPTTEDAARANLMRDRITHESWNNFNVGIKDSAREFL